MPLRSVILGLLLDAPTHGYALKKALSPALPRGQLLNDGVLYPLLAKLETAGHLARRVVARPGRPDRHVFEVTQAGREAFDAWLGGESDEDDPIRYDFFLGQPLLAKCMFFERLDRDAVVVKLRAARDRADEKLRAFRAIRKGMVARSVDPWRIAILDLGIAQNRAKRRWLDRLIAEPPACRAPQKDIA